MSAQWLGAASRPASAARRLSIRSASDALHRDVERRVGRDVGRVEAVDLDELDVAGGRYRRRGDLAAVYRVARHADDELLRVVLVLQFQLVRARAAARGGRETE